jgi:hypothetical protein
MGGLELGFLQEILGTRRKNVFICIFSGFHFIFSINYAVGKEEPDSEFLTPQF